MKEQRTLTRAESHVELRFVAVVVRESACCQVLCSLWLV